MRKRTCLWLIAATFTLAGCSSGASEPGPAPLSGSTQNGLAAGTTFNGSADGKTTSPIKHVIVIIGENRTFDHVFATYQPKKGQTVANLLSKGIINADGTPGPNFAVAGQFSAIDSKPAQDQLPLDNPQPTTFQVSPGDKSAYDKLPEPGLGGPEAPFVPTVAVATAVENGLEPQDGLGSDGAGRRVVARRPYGSGLPTAQELASDVCRMGVGDCGNPTIRGWRCMT